MQVVARSIRRVAGDWCFDNVKMASDYIVKLLKTTDGLAEVKSVFR